MASVTFSLAWARTSAALGPTVLHSPWPDNIFQRQTFTVKENSKHTKWCWPSHETRSTARAHEFPQRLPLLSQPRQLLWHCLVGHRIQARKKTASSLVCSGSEDVKKHQSAWRHNIPSKDHQASRSPSTLRPDQNCDLIWHQPRGHPAGEGSTSTSLITGLWPAESPALPAQQPTGPRAIWK